MNVISLQSENIVDDLILNYSVTDKADGEHYALLIYEKKTLIFYNFFLINGEKYKKYIFLTFKEFKLSQENTRVVISGNNTKLYLNNLKSYIKNISILNYSDFKLKDNESNFISLLFNNNL